MREVEIYINTSSEKATTPKPDTSQPLMVGIVKDDGDKLSIFFNKSLPAGYARKTLLTKLQIDPVTSEVNEFVVATDICTGPDANGTTSVYPIGANVRLTLVGGTPAATIAVELLTAEANVTDVEGKTIYGSKRLIVPVRYSVDTLTSEKISDGVYKLYWVDMLVYNATMVLKDELVYNGETVYKAIVDSTADPSASGDFVAATQEDLICASTIKLTDSNSMLTSITTSMLITRYLKSVCQFNALQAALIKDGYSKELIVADEISFNKEKSLIYLVEGKQYTALLFLLKAFAEYKNLFGNTKLNQPI